MGSADALRPRISHGAASDLGAAAAKPKAKVLPKPGFAKARAAAKMASEVAPAKPESRLRSSRSQLPRRASSPPAPVGPAANADPATSRRAVRSSGLHSATAASQAREAALRQAFPARNQSPRRRELSPQPKPRTPVTRSARLATSGRTEVQAPVRQQGAAADKNRQAVQALRRLVDLKEVICAEDKTKSPQLPIGATDTPRSLRGSSVLVHDIASEEVFPPIVMDDLAGQAAEVASTACSPSAGLSLYSAAAGGGGGSSATDERMRQLVLENQALREAFGDTQKRLMELEDERQCFLDEGVYDVVNSICGQTGLSPRAGLTGLMGDVDNSAAKTNGDGAAITFHIGSTDPSTDLLALAGSPSVLAGSPAALPLSPLSLAQMVARRSEQDLRSAELSGENEKLRRELERTTKILEVLEQQRHVAEDKMLALEQEHAVLVRRLAEMQTGVSNLELSPGESDIMDLEDHARKGSESMSEVATEQVMWSRKKSEDVTLGDHDAGHRNAASAGKPQEPQQGVPINGGDRTLEPWELEDAW